MSNNTITKPRSTFAAALGVAGVLCLIATGFVLGDDIFWDNPAGGSFGDPNNWNPNTVPGVADVAVFNLGIDPAYSVTFDTDVTNAALFVRNDHVSMDLGGFTYDLTEEHGAERSLVVGDASGQVGHLTLSNGTVTGVHAVVGLWGDSTGDLTLNGPETLLDVSACLTVGNDGSAVMTVSGGASARSQDVSVGEHDFGNSGRLKVTDPDSLLQVGYWFLIGIEGQGRFEAENGAQIESQWATVVGVGPTSVGSATIRGAGTSWTNDAWMKVGEWGNGTLIVEDSASLVISDGELWVGMEQDSVGDVQVAGLGSSIAGSSDGSSVVGVSGEGHLSVQNGGAVEVSQLVVSREGGSLGTVVVSTGPDGGSRLQNGYGNIAGYAGSYGEVTVEGEGSVWSNNGELYIGGNGVGPEGSEASSAIVSGAEGHLNVLVGGLVEVADHCRVALLSGDIGNVQVSGPNAVWNLNLGVPESTGLTLGQGGHAELSVSDGGAVNVATAMELAAWSDSVGAATVTGGESSLTVGWIIAVGGGGDGDLSIYDGGLVSTQCGLTATWADSTGDVLVSGLNSRFEVLDPGRGFLVGREGVGTLRVEDSGELAIAGSLEVAEQPGGVGHATIAGGATATIGRMEIGIWEGSTGDLTVTNLNSSLNVTAWTGNVAIGVGGEGSLTVSDQATMTLQGNWGFVGTESTGVGHMTVTGDGSTFTSVIAPFTVGNSGFGTLDVLEGGLVNIASGELWIGLKPGSEGYVTVSGSRSRLEEASNYPSLVGGEGWGTLTVDQGGYASFSLITIGDNASGAGEVSVSNGSMIHSDQDICVGRGGQGTLYIQGGSLVETDWGYIANDPGSTGEVKLTDDNSTWNLYRMLSVGGAPDHSGGVGTLTLDGDNTFVRVGYGPDGGTLLLWENGDIYLNGGRIVVGGDVFYGPGTLVVRENGTLAGKGTIHGTVRNSGGMVSPGASAGRLSIDGDYDQTGAGLLAIELGGTEPSSEYDYLSVSSAANLDGQLQIDFINGFVPSYDDVFVIVNAGAVNGHFANAETQYVGPWGMCDVTYDGTTVTLTHFTVNSYTLTVGVNYGTFGTVDVEPSQPSYMGGTWVKVTAQPAPGFAFYQWTGDASDPNANPVWVYMDSNKSLTAILYPTTPIDPNSIYWRLLPNGPWQPCGVGAGTGLMGTLVIGCAFLGLRRRRF